MDIFRVACARGSYVGPTSETLELTTVQLFNVFFFLLIKYCPCNKVKIVVGSLKY